MSGRRDARTGNGRTERGDVQQRRARASTARDTSRAGWREQVRRQGIQPIASVDELAFPGMWQSDKELDDFLADLYASRRASMP